MYHTHPRANFNSMRLGLVQGRMGPDFFLNEGLKMASRAPDSDDHGVKKRSRKTMVRIFIDHFGMEPEIISSVWMRLNLSPSIKIPKNSKPQHLLWAFLFMKVYSTENVLTGIAGGVDPKSFRKWRNIFIKAVSKLFDQEVCVGCSCLIFHFISKRN